MAMAQTVTFTCDNEGCQETETDEGAINDKWFGFTATIHESKHNVSITAMSEIAPGDWQDWSKHACSTDCLGPAIEQALNKYKDIAPKKIKSKNNILYTPKKKKR